MTIGSFFVDGFIGGYADAATAGADYELQIGSYEMHNLRTFMPTGRVAYGLSVTNENAQLAIGAMADDQCSAGHVYGQYHN